MRFWCEDQPLEGQQAMPWDSGQCLGTSGQCPGKCPGTSGHGQCPGTRAQCPRTSGQCPGTAGIETWAGHSERPGTTSRTSQGHLRMSRENQTRFWDIPQMARGWPRDVLAIYFSQDVPYPMAQSKMTKHLVERPSGSRPRYIYVPSKRVGRRTRIYPPPLHNVL